MPFIPDPFLCCDLLRHSGVLLSQEINLPPHSDVLLPHSDVLLPQEKGPIPPSSLLSRLPFTPLTRLFAIPDHPWVDTSVRTA